MVDWDFTEVLIGIIDIEVGSENGFPDPYKAEQPVTAIALKYIGGHMFVFGCGDYEVKGKERYMKCNDEAHLLKMFLKLWADKCPDALTGWNTKFFDVPYLVNRIRKILGEDEVKKLSPWGMIRERTAHVMNREMTVYELVGVGELDYLELYKWYSPNGKSQESYKLDNIANVELGKKKLSYDDYDNLHDLYKRNFQLFIEYNIVDVELIEEMDDKLKLLELALTLAYDTKTNYDDVFAQTRMWDAQLSLEPEYHCSSTCS
jgi:DNA polymerase elongation subunit (family B)